ncbi:MAG: helix-turn-helix domain-containing protein [Candidatus Methylumidiphilus sp.]
MSETIITARMRSDGEVVEILADGSEKPFPKTPMRPPLSDEEIEAAALSDPDAQPLTEADFKRMKRTPRAKIIRRALGLSPEEFATRFHIPLAELTAWEQGQTEPDPVAKAYLTVIARDSDSVEKALRA